MCSNVMENGIKLTATLESQSPMIHFQARETGAVLRASEVKPKLDRFLIKKMIKNLVANSQLTNEEALKKLKKDYPQYFCNTKLNDALNYKIQIVTHCNNEEDQRKEVDLKYYKIFYGNMGPQGRENPKGGILAKLDLTIICFNKELRHIIQTYLEEFFIVTNFGTMQGKGFGSFIVENSVEIDENEISEEERNEIAIMLKEETESNSCYEMVFSGRKNELEEIDRGCQDKFKKIQFFYGTMKSGYNFKGRYIRSYIYQYMHLKGIDNEKAWMKQNGLAPIVGRRPVQQQQNPNPHYVRAFLGTSETIRYKAENGGVTIKIEHDVPITDPGKLERVPSPIFFKIIKNVVFIVAKPVLAEIYGQQFKFTGINKSSRQLSVPTCEEFDIQDFLSSYVSFYNGLSSSEFLDKNSIQIKEIE